MMTMTTGTTMMMQIHMSTCNGQKLTSNHRIYEIVRKVSKHLHPNNNHSFITAKKSPERKQPYIYQVVKCLATPATKTYFYPNMILGHTFKIL